MKNDIIPQRAISPTQPAVASFQADDQFMYPAYRSHEIDEIYLRITEIEAEGPTGGSRSVGLAQLGVDTDSTATSDDSPSRPKRFIHYLAPILIAALVLAATGYISLNTWMAHSQMNEVIVQTKRV